MANVKPRYISPVKRLRPNMPWLERMRVLLELDEKQLALIMDLPVLRVQDARRGMSISSDEAYTKLLDYCTEKLGLVYAVKKELQQRLEDDRKERLLSRERIRGNVKTTVN